MATPIPTTNDFTQFFEDVVPPESFDEKKAQMDSFIKSQSECKRKIVLITSGGTTVPLESRTVRFIDNFSIGTRGATSAEYFLKQGYAVLFLHRQRSLQPFCQRIDRNVLDDLHVSTDGSDTVTVNPESLQRLLPVVRDYHRFKDTGVICQLEFTTLTEYLLLLRAASMSLRVCGPRAMLYLAAAVSDFYVPHGQMPEHKIQSSEGALQLTLEMTPKMLKPLVKEWVPQAFIVSFKLETNPSLLMEKARGALRRYQHQMVIANILETRKREIFIVTLNSEEEIRLSEADIQSGREIEEPLIQKLSEFHSNLLSSQPAT